MQYRLRIEGEDGLSVDRLVAKEFVLRMLQLDEWNVPGSVTRGSSSSMILSTNASASAEATGRNAGDATPTDPRSFLLESGATTNMAKIATLGVFLNLSGQSSFGPTEARDLLIRCGERPPANLGRDFKETERLRWIARDTKRGQWFVTNDGRRAYETRFANLETVRAPKRVRKVSSPPGGAEPVAEARAEKRGDVLNTGIGNGVSSIGPMAVIDRMCSEGFFVEWRSTADMLEEAAKQGTTLTRTDTTSLLPKYVRKKKLVREKRSVDGARPVWHYAYPSTE